MCAWASSTTPPPSSRPAAPTSSIAPALQSSSPSPPRCIRPRALTPGRHAPQRPLPGLPHAHGGRAGCHRGRHVLHQRGHCCKACLVCSLAHTRLRSAPRPGPSRRCAGRDLSASASWAAWSTARSSTSRCRVWVATCHRPQLSLPPPPHPASQPRPASPAQLRSQSLCAPRTQRGPTSPLSVGRVTTTATRTSTAGGGDDATSVVGGDDPHLCHIPYLYALLICLVITLY